jgi:hypothetical protein
VRIVRFAGPNTPILEAETTFSGPSLGVCDIMGGRYSATLVGGGAELEWSDGDRWVRVSARRRRSTTAAIKTRMGTAPPSEALPPATRSPTRGDWLLRPGDQAGARTLVHRTPPPTVVRRVLGHGFTPVSEVANRRAESARLGVATQEGAETQPQRHAGSGQGQHANANSSGGVRSSSGSSSGGGGNCDSFQYRPLARNQSQDPSVRHDRAWKKAGPFEQVSIQMTRRGVGLHIDQVGEVLSVSTEATDAGAVSDAPALSLSLSLSLSLCLSLPLSASLWLSMFWQLHSRCVWRRWWVTSSAK